MRTQIRDAEELRINQDIYVLLENVDGIDIFAKARLLLFDGENSAVILECDNGVYNFSYNILWTSINDSDKIITQEDINKCRDRMRTLLSNLVLVV